MITAAILPQTPSLQGFAKILPTLSCDQLPLVERMMQDSLRALPKTDPRHDVMQLALADVRARHLKLSGGTP